MAIRPKDQALSDACARMAAAARDAVGWVDDNPDLAGAGADSVRRAMREAAVNARRLSRAASRPMSVGVFGVSQAGKSTMIGKLVTPPQNPAAVVFGSGDERRALDFGAEVNPQGGNETTGLVTRLSLVELDTPAGFPVALRVFREVDVIKVLVNSFVLDLQAAYRHGPMAEDGRRPDHSPTEERMNALFDRLSSAAEPELTGGLAIEDVYEIRGYIDEKLPRHPLRSDAFGEHYWPAIEDSLTHWPAKQRAEALAPLWGELPEFTELYLRLKDVLDRLGHPEFVYAPLNAITDRLPRKSVLHAETIYVLDDRGGEPPTRLTVMSDTGVSAMAEACEITALTSELCVTLEKAPWPFFEHTDLLDFPGARSREDTEPDRLLRDPDKPHARAHCFLRGKVAVLFDNYAADLDLNAMALCVGPEMAEVKAMTDLVQAWIDRTHGAGPTARANRPTAMFFCATKSDMMFSLAAGDSYDFAITQRFKNNFGPFAKWIDDWTPGRAFDNVFLTRHPGRRNDGLFTYASAPSPSGADDEAPAETGLAPAFVERLPAFEQAFLANEMVGRHIAAPTEKLKALLELNDGGVTLLADRLRPVCDPDVKFQQIEAEAQKAAQGVLTALGPLYESEDPEARASERVAKATEMAEALSRKPDLIPSFISLFHLSADDAAAAFLERQRHRGATQAPSEFVIDLATGQAKKADPAGGGDGAALVAHWLERLEARIADPTVAGFFGVDPDLVRGFAAELRVAADRLDLAAQIDARIGATGAARDETALRAGAEAALVVNELVNHLGMRGKDGRFADRAEMGEGQTPELPASRDDARMARFSFAIDWLRSAPSAARENAMWRRGGSVDPEQNARLGTILETVRGAVAVPGE